MTSLHAGAVSAFPEKLKTRKGTASQESLNALTTPNTDTSNNAAEYISFYSGRRQYIGIFDFIMPIDTTIDEIRSMVIEVNYLGPEYSNQRWIWKLRDFKNRKWVEVGDNKGTMDDVWNHIIFDVPGDLQRFVSTSGKIKLQYRSNRDRNGSKASHIDYLAINMEQAPDKSVPIKVPEPDPEPNPDPEPDPDPEPEQTSGNVWSPMPGTSWHLQLQGDIDTSINVKMYDIDLFDTPQGIIDELHMRGSAVICYFSAGSWEDWRPDADSFPAYVTGNSNGWPGEKWLDIRQRDILGMIMRARLDLAVAKGCDGVDPDNVDGFSNKTGFPLTYTDQMNYNKWLANEAHARGLSVGLKNDLEQLADLEPFFDWALNEQCFEYNECDLLMPFIENGKAVFHVEYEVDPAMLCSKANAMGFDSLVKLYDLDTWRIDCRDFP